MAEVKVPDHQLAALKVLTEADGSERFITTASATLRRELLGLGLVRRRFVRSGSGFGHEQAVFSITPAGWQQLRNS